MDYKEFNKQLGLMKSKGKKYLYRFTRNQEKYLQIAYFSCKMLHFGFWLTKNGLFKYY